jgi:hypothetical protein
MKTSERVLAAAVFATAVGYAGFSVAGPPGHTVQSRVISGVGLHVSGISGGGGARVISTGTHGGGTSGISGGGTSGISGGGTSGISGGGTSGISGGGTSGISGGGTSGISGGGTNGISGGG